MVPSSSIQTIQYGDSKLVIVCPPFYVAAAVAFSIVAALATIAFVLTGELLIATLGPVFIVSLGLATTSATAILDRSAGSLQVRRRVFAIFVKDRTVPLSSVRNVQIVTGKGTRRLEFATRNGFLPVGFMSSQSGVRDAAEAINKFLQST